MNKSKLAEMKCAACEGGAKPLTRDEARAYAKELDGWSLSADGKSVVRDYRMKNFMAAIGLMDR